MTCEERVTEYDRPLLAEGIDSEGEGGGIIAW
jgi:hypothetical protein